MKRKLKLVALKLAGIALVATAGSVQAKTTLSWNMVLEPPHLDPTEGSASAIGRVTYANIFEGLTRIDRNGKVQPALAASWTISNDGLTYRFNLHENVHFHDGAAFDCSDVKFSFERAMGDNSVNPHKQLFEPISRVECVDPATVKIRLKRPTGTFLFNLGGVAAVIVDPASADNNKTDPIGTGPFKFKRWVRGDRVELERNGAYWGKPVALSAATFRFISDSSAIVAALKAGDLDVAFIAAEVLPAFEKDPAFKVHRGTTEGETILALNNGVKPLDDLRVRRAISYAVDRQAVIDGAMFGQAVPIGSHFSPNDPGYVDLTGRYPYDPERAKSLLKEAGYGKGATLRLTLPPIAYARRSGEIIATQLAEVGVKVKIIPVEWAQWLDQVYKRFDYDMTIVAHVEPADIAIYARDYYFNYDNPEFKALYKTYVGTLDQAEAKKLLGDMQRKLADDAVNVFLFQLPAIVVAKAKLEGLWKNYPILVNDLTEVHWRQ